jgi:hypothetical protein
MVRKRSEKPKTDKELKAIAARIIKAAKEVEELEEIVQLGIPLEDANGMRYLPGVQDAVKTLKEKGWLLNTWLGHK